MIYAVVLGITKYCAKKQSLLQHTDFQWNNFDEVEFCPDHRITNLQK